MAHCIAAGAIGLGAGTDAGTVRRLQNRVDVDVAALRSSVGDASIVPALLTGVGTIPRRSVGSERPVFDTYSGPGLFYGEIPTGARTNAFFLGQGAVSAVGADVTVVVHLGNGSFGIRKKSDFDG